MSRQISQMKLPYKFTVNKEVIYEMSFCKEFVIPSGFTCPVNDNFDFTAKPHSMSKNTLVEYDVKIMKFKNIGNDPKKPGGGEVSFQYKIFSEGNNREDYNGLENYNRLELDFCKEDAAVESEPASGGEAKKELKLQHWPTLWIFGFGLDGISCG
ncbi:unnamed protein product [Rhizophagus irregularis]|nr:unnamed protein product [Rhizophagus irregularis]CAB5378337.1 unnamed protein product [Rhizophagus irregularis]